jgi:RNA-directed DNA polymerase
MRQKTELKITLQAAATGEARSGGMEGTEARTAETEIESQAAGGPLMEVIVERDNLRKALAHVKRNKGAAGIDGMSLDALAPYLKEHWPVIRVQLLEGSYKPQPVRRVEIPKASGGTRSLGIPTVLDRFIQQAVLQVLQAAWDPTFSEHSFGFRPSRSAHQAVARAQQLIASGHGIVVDLDLEKFLDTAS